MTRCVFWESPVVLANFLIIHIPVCLLPFVSLEAFEVTSSVMYLGMMEEDRERGSNDWDRLRVSSIERKQTCIFFKPQLF